MADEDDVRRAEARRLEAERHKLELESQEIEHRLHTPWWQGQRFAQYLVAIVITAALLFGWTRVYLEPILRKETEVNKLVAERNAVRNELLTAQRDSLQDLSNKLNRERDQLVAERDRLADESNRLKEEQSQLVAERDRLRRDRDDLEERQSVLRSIVTRLNQAVYKVAKGNQKFFSILNNQDPINALDRSYGWEMWSDNWFGQLGYYLVAKHPDIRAVDRTIIGRFIEIEDMKRDHPDDWRRRLEKFVAGPNGGPVLALDYSYLALHDDPAAAVGGMLYRPGGKDIEFYAPLSQWSERLGALYGGS
jgi:hypothetical protein